MTTTADDPSILPTTVHVFQDHPVWQQYAKWWMVPRATSAPLYVGTYTVEAEPEQACWATHMAFIRAQHPGTVLIY